MTSVSNERGVFISYRRGSGAAEARLMSQFLTSHGFDVFLDVDELGAGHFNDRLLREIEERRHFLLVCSPGALDRCSSHGDWVRREIAQALRTSRNVVPVMLPGFAWPHEAELPDEVAEIRLFNAFPYDHTHWKAICGGLLSMLGRKSPSESSSAVAHRSVPAAELGGRSLRVGDIRDVVSWGWDGTRLLDEFIRIDYETLESLDGESEGHSRQWAPIFMQHPETWRMLLAPDDSIAGYWHFAPLFDDVYASAEQGMLFDGEITADRVNCFEMGGCFKVYMCQICLLPAHRSTASIKMLLGSVLDVVDELSMHDIFISDLCANAFSLAGQSLCKSFGLSYRVPHVRTGSIYSAPIGRVLACPIARGRPGLQLRYREQGLL